LPLMPVMYTKSIYIRSSSNWKRFNYLSFRNGEYSGRSLGPFMTVCRFLPPAVHGKAEKAFVRIVPSQFADSAVSDFEKLRLFYRNTDGNVNIAIFADGKIILKDTLKPFPGVRELNCTLGRPTDVRLDFEGSASPDICGISIESEKALLSITSPKEEVRDLNLQWSTALIFIPSTVCLSLT
jgi:hypothetical protein